MKDLSSVFSLNGKPYMNDKRYLTMPTRDHVYTMSPEHYIKLAADILNMSFSHVVNTRLKDHKSYAYISEAAKNGTLTIPVLDYINNTQDGLHRAMWALENGYKLIPVLIYR